MEARIVTGAAGSPHVLETPLTTPVTEEVSPDLLIGDIDSRIVKIRPMATPVDQISRLAPARKCKSMKLEYYSVDTPPEVNTLAAAVEQSASTDTALLMLNESNVFCVSDTVLAPDAMVNGHKVSVMMYVLESKDNAMKVRAIGVPSGILFPQLVLVSRFVRMGRAAAELDVQTANAQAIPVKLTNYCQIFKAQVEQSMMQRMSAKEVGWTLSDQEEVALMDMRMGMEKNFLFGVRHRFDKGLDYGEVFMTAGIWNQTSNDFTYTKGKLDALKLVALTRKAFTGNAGSARKILVAGSGFIEELSRLNTVKSLGAVETVTRWGIDFKEMHTNFGRLYVVLSEVFDMCGHADDGMVIDPEYLQKYVHIPFKAMPIDLCRSGQRNTEAVVLTEASCLVLRYPNAHMRIMAVPDGDNGGEVVPEGPGDSGDDNPFGE